MLAVGKLCIVGLITMACLTVSYTACGLFGSRLASLPKFFVAVVLSVAILSALSKKIASWEEWEDEIVGELTVHQDMWLFRITWSLWICLSFGLGIWWKLHWLFHCGLVVGGSLVWLYVFDVSLEFFGNWDNLIATVCSDPEHALKMLGTGLLLVLVTGGFCLGYYHGLTMAKPATEALTPTEEQPYWRKAWNYLKKAWENSYNDHTPAIACPQNSHLPLRMWLSRTINISRVTMALLQAGQNVVSASSTARTFPR